MTSTYYANKVKHYEARAEHYRALLRAEEKETKVAEVKVDSARVLEAAKSCPDAARVLQKLFPDVFKNANDGIVAPIIPKTGIGIAYEGQMMALQIRNSTQDKYHRRTLYLTKNLDWKIEDDNDGYVLVARRKS